MVEILTLRAMTGAEARTLRSWPTAARRKRASATGRGCAGWPVRASGSPPLRLNSEWRTGPSGCGFRRFNALGLDGLRDRRRGGRPPTYTPEQVGEVIAASLTDPRRVGIALRQLDAGPAGGCICTRKRASPSSAAASGRSCRPRACAGALQETWFGDARSGLREKRGPSSPRHHPAGGQRRDLPRRDGTGERQELPRPTAGASRAAAGQRRTRATQEIDYGRRGYGYSSGSSCPPPGDALTAPYAGRTTANWVDFLERVEDWLAPAVHRVSAVLDNLPAHRALDVLLWALAHPRWEFVFQPTKAASLNLIEPWWKVLRSLALKGRRFARWAELCQAVEAATRYGNAHRHPFVWGKRKAPSRPRQPAPPTSRWQHRLTGWTT